METKINVKAVVRSVGTQQFVADLCGVSREAVKMWCARNSVPIDHVAKLSAISKVRPELLNRHLARVYAKQRRTN